MSLTYLERYRQRAGLTLRDAAQRLSLSAKKLLSYEQGLSVPGALVIRHMARLYGCTSDQLLGLSHNNQKGNEHENENHRYPRSCRYASNCGDKWREI